MNRITDKFLLLSRIIMTLAVILAACVFMAKPVKAEIASGTCGTCSWEISDEGVLTIRPTDGVSGTLIEPDRFNIPQSWPWYDNRSAVNSVVIEDGVKAGTDIRGMFSNMANLSSVRGNLDTSQVTDMEGVFSRCSKLTDISALSSWNTENVLSMSGMFHSCSKLSDISALSSWNTGNVLNMAEVFYSCSKLTDISALSSWNTGNVLNMMRLFCGCSELTGIDALSGWNTGNVTNMVGLFSSCKNLTDISALSGWNTGNVHDMSHMFLYCEKITDISALSSWDTGDVTDMSHMFDYCRGITDLSALSGWNTGSVTDMSFMFQSCGKLTVVDALSGWDTSHVTNMMYMFYECDSMVSLDISNWDTGAATSMLWMFDNCPYLRQIKIGERFSFKGNNININYQVLLPTPYNSVVSGATGKWIRTDNAYGPYTPYELRDEYSPDMAGTWVWELKESAALITFDPKGGYTNRPTISQDGRYSAITFPTATRPGYILAGWSKSEAGTSQIYQPGRDLNNPYIPSAGERTTFYALWAVAVDYTVNHYKQNVSLTAYDLAETEALQGPQSKTITVPVKEYEGFRNPAVQQVTLIQGQEIVVNYYYDRKLYTVRYDANGAGSGTMDDQIILMGMTTRLNDNKFSWDDHVFMGWNTKADGSGTYYGDGQTALDIASDGDTLTLYAQWLDITGKTVEATNGVYEVKIHAGETVTIPELPAGTHYIVEEVDIPDGWRQSGTVGTEGTITANTTSGAVISNTYSAEGSITLFAYKQMEDSSLQGGEFTFELLEVQGQEKTVIQTKKNGTIDNRQVILDDNGDEITNPYYGMYVVNFDTIAYSDDGTFKYVIREKAGDAEDIEYDEHEEEVTVTVTDRLNGLLVCKAEYDHDGPVFINKKIARVDRDKTGILAVTKDVANMVTDQEFTFAVSLTDDEGTALTDTYATDIVPSGKKDSYEESDIIRSASVTSGGTIVLKSGESAVIPELPEGAVFAVSEVDIPDGYELVSSAGSEGMIAENTVSEADFQNVYNAEGTAQISVSKVYEGGTIEENRFKFILADDTGRTLQEAYAQTDGSVVFDPISYTQEIFESQPVPENGLVFHYSVYEAKDDNEDIVYDSHVLNVKVTVRDNGNGTLGTEVEYVKVNDTDMTVFTNVYPHTSAAIRAVKKFEHGDLSQKQFRFSLLENGIEVGTAVSSAEGTVSFDEITYHLSDVGSHTYTIKEVTTAENIAWDTHEETVTVTVSKVSDTELNAQVAYDADGAVFTNNAFTPKDLTVTKTVTGNMGDKSKEFGFSLTLTPPDGKDLPETLSYEKGEETGTVALADGKYSFTLAHGESITFKNIDADTRYTVKEEGVLFQGYTVTKNNASGTILDEDVTAGFINHKFVSVPTSVDTNVGLAAVLALAALLGIGGFYGYKKKFG